MTWRTGHDLYLACGVCGGVLSMATAGSVDRMKTIEKWDGVHAVCREKPSAVDEGDDEAADPPTRPST